MSASLAPESWLPAHTTVLRPWRQAVRGGSRDDRMFSEVAARVPPLIAELECAFPADMIAPGERALVSLSAMDAESRIQPRALGRFMIRTESVASSKIERVSASTDDFARAIAGNKSNSSAVSMVAATAALTTMVSTAGESRVISLNDIEIAHRELMKDDASEGPYAGRMREEQNWIGGSDHSPRGALYVPPPADLVPGLMLDLVRFCNRDDLPVLAQLTIAHAQFESIHPFGDGNGRIGRALMNAILRRRGVTAYAVVPLASGLLARRDEYFDSLTDYREGNLHPLLDLVLRSAEVAGEEGRVSVRRIAGLPDEWAQRSGARAGSSAALLLPALFDNPVLSAADIEQITTTALGQVYSAIRRLEGEGIVHEITGRKRDRVWVATDLMAELEDLDLRIAARMRAR